MYSLLFLIVSSFVFSLFLTPIARNLAHRWGFVDHPDQGRKLHTVPIPRVGGIAIVASYLLAFGALMVSGLQAARIVHGGLPLAVRLLPAAGLIFGIGVLDDVFTLKAGPKFAVQILAAGLAFFAGVRVHGFGGYQVGEWWSLPATVFWLVLCTNAVNLIDGVDGLAAGVGLFATATTLLAALLQNNVDLALAVAPLLGCLLGFLRYNFNPATVFLGDSGSLFIGFVLGACSILWSQKSATILGMTAPLLALAIPLLDTALAVVRRFLRAQPLFTADRGHIHHRLLDRGFSPRGVALVIYAICALTAILSLLMMNQNFEGVVVVLFCAATWIGVQHLGYVEFGVAGRMFVEGAFRRLLNSQIALQVVEQKLQSAHTPDECWDVIQESAKEFGFHSVEMAIAGRRYGYQDGSRADGSWYVRIPLSNSEFVELTREFDCSGQHNVVVPYAEAVRRILEPKLGRFDRARAAVWTQV
jgi:UDP-GlcNAc:undecaprenyl-phosphate GlcNAc-1-phosphate transferase